MICKYLDAFLLPDRHIAFRIDTKKPAHLGDVMTVVFFLARRIEELVNPRPFGVYAERDAHLPYFAHAWFALWRFCLSADAKQRDELRLLQCYHPTPSRFPTMDDFHYKGWEHPDELLELRAKLERAHSLDWGGDYHEPDVFKLVPPNAEPATSAPPRKPSAPRKRPATDSANLPTLF